MRWRVFLFTDIQRSTRLWSDYTDEMASAISEHNRVITEIVSHNQGAVLKNTGDGVLAMFDDGVPAMSAAIDIQRWLDHRVWGSVGHLRVRMGLHTGEPVLLDTGEITGPVINECARLHAAGHGGQILVSDRLAATVIDRLPPGCGLQSLGQHTLPDLATATIHQLCHPDLVADFPPLRTSVGSELDLVGRASSFRGRDRELAYLEAVDTPRLVTLIGSGGVGKTRLAQILLARRGVRHVDGVRVIDLSTISVGDEIAAAVATSLRIEHSPASSAEEMTPTLQVAQWLQSKDMLLLLDNCEHVGVAAAELVRVLLATAPRLSLICTSRQALGVAGEFVYVVLPLRVEAAGQDARDSPAVELFIDRAREVRPGYRPDDREIAQIQRVCLELDGLPLAIELAAARLAVEDLDAVSSMLMFQSPRSGDERPQASSRHRSLRDLVAWSYDTLTTDEQTLFGRLSIFSGAFTLRAAVYVCGGEKWRDHRFGDDVSDLMASLVAKSMVVRTETGSTLRLLAPIRSVAVSIVDVADLEILRRRFVDWYVGWAGEMSQALRTSDEERAALALAAEFDNLRATHRIALEDGDEESAATVVAALLTFAVHRFRFEVAAWAEASLRSPRTPDHLRPVLHGLLGIRAWMRGDLAAAKRHADDGVEIEQRLGLAVSIHARLVRLAVAGYEQRFEDAFNEFNIAYQRARELEHPAWRIEVLVFSAVGMNKQGASDLASQIAERAASLAAKLDNPTSLAWARYVVAESVYHDDPEMAIEFLDEASELARRVGNEWVLGLVQVSLAKQYRRAGRTLEAAVALLECLDRWSRAENWSEQWRTVREVAQLCADVERYEDAARLLAAAEAATSVIPVSPAEAVEILVLHGRVDEVLGSDRRKRLQEKGRLRGLVSPDDVVAQAHEAMRFVLHRAELAARA